LQSRRSTLTLTQVDALLTELSSHSPFSSPQITQTLHPPSNRRPKLLLLQRLYTSLSPFAASLLTQIILQDLSPLVNPPPTPRTGTRGLLLEYNQKSRWVFEKWDLMRLWDGGTGRMGRIWKVRGVLEEAVEELEIMGRGERVDVKVGRCIEVCSESSRARCTFRLHLLELIMTGVPLYCRFQSAKRDARFSTCSRNLKSLDAVPSGQRQSMMANGKQALLSFSLVELRATES
jgi:hypothetical protein